MSRGLAWKFAGISIAIVSPLLFTSSWAGTDIILWAAIPWFLPLITPSWDPHGEANFRFDALAGFLIGLCVLARYASILFAAYAMLVIAAQSRLRPALAAQRITALGAGLLPALATQAYVNYVVAVGEAAPAGIVLTQERIMGIVVRAWENVMTFGAADDGLFFWLPPWLKLWNRSGYEPVALTVAGIVLVVVAVGVGVLPARLPVLARALDLRFVAGELLIALPLFLWICGLFSDFAYISEPRYYEPLRPLAVFLAYGLATMDNSGRRTGIAFALRYLGRSYLCAFLLLTAAETALMLRPTGRTAAWARGVMLATAITHRWPSSGITYESSPARRFVVDLMNREPKALLLTNVEHWFYAAPDADRSRIMRWEPCNSLWAKQITGPAHLFFLVQDDGGPPDELHWSDPLHGGDCLKRWPGLTMIRRFSNEKLKVLQADIPEGVRVPLTPA